MTEINHTAKICSVRKSSEQPKVIAFRGVTTGTVYFPSKYGTKDIWIGIEGKNIRVFTAVNASRSLNYEPIYQGDETFTIEIK